MRKPDIRTKPLLVEALVLLSMLVYVPQSSAACTEAQNRAAAHLFLTLVTHKGLLIGIPKKNEITMMRPYITTELAKLFEAAARVEKKHFDQTKGLEPPLRQGILVVRPSEGYNNFYVSKAVERYKKSQVYIDFQFLDLNVTPNPPHTIDEWRGRVEVKPEGKSCLVNNIFFDPHSDSGSLIDTISNMESELRQ